MGRMKNDFNKYWTQGYICAVCKLIDMYGCETEAIELFKICRITKDEFDKYEIDQYDREILLQHWEELHQSESMKKHLNPHNHE